MIGKTFFMKQQSISQTEHRRSADEIGVLIDWITQEIGTLSSKRHISQNAIVTWLIRKRQSLNQELLELEDK